MDIIANVLRTAKHPFRRTEDQPTKALQHRYERRKIKEHLRLCEWREQWLPEMGVARLLRHKREYARTQRPD